MSEHSPRNSVDSVTALVRELNVIGLPAVLWTVIFCTALLKSDGTTMSWMFKYLIRTWFGLLAFWGVSAGVVAAFRSREKKHLVPIAVGEPSNVAEQKSAA
jgi:hypothetical protein